MNSLLRLFYIMLILYIMLCPQLEKNRENNILKVHNYSISKLDIKYIYLKILSLRLLFIVLFTT